MNKAYIEMMKIQTRRDRRLDLMASAFGWTVTGIGALIFSGFAYTLLIMFLSLGPR